MILKNVKYICMRYEQEARSLLSRSRMTVMGVLLAASTVGCQASSDLEGVVYDSLQGAPVQSGSADTGIYSSKEDFLTNSRVALPLSIILRNQQAGGGLQIAYGSGWVPGAVGIFNGGENCVPASEEKVSTYKQLFDEFQKDQTVNRRLIQAITDGEKPNCYDYLHQH